MSDRTGEENRRVIAEIANEVETERKIIFKKKKIYIHVVTL